MTKLRALLGWFGTQLMKPWVWGLALLAISAGTLLKPEFDKQSAFSLGVSLTAAVYAFLYQITNKRSDRLVEQLERQQEIIQSLTEMKTHEIGKEIAEHMGAVMVERPNITKH